MTLLGLSILIATVSFFCYRHPPSSWTLSFLEWTRRPSLHDIRRQNHAPETILALDEIAGAEAPPVTEEGKMEKDTTGIHKPKDIIKDELDCKSMPPPVMRKPPKNSMTPPITTPTTSTVLLPAFPALNSAQRAPGSRSPPRLNPMPTLQSIPLRSPTSSSGLMSPPMRPLPSRTPQASSSLALPPTHNSIPAKPRKKVLLSPGHSPLDWARLASSPDVNLSGLPPSSSYLRVPPSLLRQYTGRKGKDAWTVLGGKVYNITPYLPYHPGGVPELMKAAGRDGTKLFGEVHPWVNWEGMLEGCLVGLACDEGDARAKSTLEEMD